MAVKRCKFCGKRLDADGLCVNLNCANFTKTNILIKDQQENLREEEKKDRVRETDGNASS